MRFSVFQIQSTVATHTHLKQGATLWLLASGLQLAIRSAEGANQVDSFIHSASINSINYSSQPENSNPRKDTFLTTTFDFTINQRSEQKRSSSPLLSTAATGSALTIAPKSTRLSRIQRSPSRNHSVRSSSQKQLRFCATSSFRTTSQMMRICIRTLSLQSLII
jgi:hypothetical protein